VVDPGESDLHGLSPSVRRCHRIVYPRADAGLLDAEFRSA
jgi:hypothetical protein